jgi:hypothetical protein
MENTELSDLVLDLQAQLVGMQVRLERLEMRDVAHTTIGMLSDDSRPVPGSR